MQHAGGAEKRQFVNTMIFGWNDFRGVTIFPPLLVLDFTFWAIFARQFSGREDDCVVGNRQNPMGPCEWTLNLSHLHILTHPLRIHYIGTIGKAETHYIANIRGYASGTNLGSPGPTDFSWIGED